MAPLFYVDKSLRVFSKPLTKFFATLLRYTFYLQCKVKAF
jgi:hypothetical protein